MPPVRGTHPEGEDLPCKRPHQLRGTLPVHRAPLAAPRIPAARPPAAAVQGGQGFGVVFRRGSGGRQGQRVYVEAGPDLEDHFQSGRIPQVHQTPVHGTFVE